ncbi:hypothetical protein BKA67DRAFT_665025 [Truncatella angustata]|uniref:Carrier domain-containing protein n=1 Tax=Truncatella angustata TaxID=152316 RepID=A0A9P8RFR2_9PEZI|nr:uncharacterized protein BKA67DRAFT_665025 [Truncatella angustata]KAH6645189.1 hypothetical protein BKA67DRAFT_665025 [Truncatella angustata]
MEQAKSMPIAITGMACRFPGQADTPERLWNVCAAARNTWSEWPKDRLNEEAFLHTQPEHLGTFHSRGGHFLEEDVFRWDASFFNFTADMARAMDPQIRLLLETAFEAFQTAGLSLENIAGSQTAVFAGSMFRDYHDLLMRDAENLPRYHVTGNAAAFTANRLSHFFDLRGPSVSVDTACSTTLAALHLACQSIRTGESNMAVVGGSNLILHPGSSTSLSNLGLTGRAGKSFSFDSRAQGYGRGEGVACIVLKPLKDAVRDGDPIRAVIRETGMNQDGRTQTITTPSQDAQQQLILNCYERAGLDPCDTTYVEAHGTGTIAGDRIELGALGATIGKNRTEDNPLYVGSIKANFGHTESTSGLAAVIKVAMMLEHGQIPPQANFEKHNPRIDFEALNIKIPTITREWSNVPVRRASVSNFGAGGANTHVIMEDPSYLLNLAKHTRKESLSLKKHETKGKSDIHIDTAVDSWYPAAGSSSPISPSSPCSISTPGSALTPAETMTPSGTPIKGAKNTTDSGLGTSHENEHAGTNEDCSLVFTLSARDEPSLRASAYSFANYLDQPGPYFTLPSLAYTMNEKRTSFPWRVAVMACSSSELQETLQSESLKLTNSTQVPKLGFVFTGQGAQWHAMGRELINSYSEFREALQEGGDFIHELGATWNPIEELSRSAEETKLNQPCLSFPMSVLLQLALVRLLRSWGVVPTATTGHSSGEISAAYASGGLTFKQAVAVAYVRGRLTSEFVESGQAHGGMTAVATSKQKALEYLNAADVETTAVIACINSPSSVTISGEIGSLEKIEALAANENVMFRRLKVPAAYHSSEMEALADGYLNALKPHFEVPSPERFTATFSSPVTGSIVREPSSVHNPSHWVRNMVQPVLFDDCLEAMLTRPENAIGQSLKSTVDILIEIGPHGALQGPIRQILDNMNLRALKTNVSSCLKRGEDASKTMREIAVFLYCKGYPVNVTSVNVLHQPSTLQVLHDLPTYKWNHSSRYSGVSPIVTDYMQRNSPKHDLLGTRVEGINPEQAIWRNTLRISDLPWLQHHVVQSEVLYPAAGLLVMVTEAMRQLDDEEGQVSNGYNLNNVDLSKAVIFPASGDDLEIQLVIKQPSTSSTSAAQNRQFVFYSRTGRGNWAKHCQGSITPAQHATTGVPVGGLGLLPMDIDHFYKHVERSGPTLGPSFRNITRLSGGDFAAEATVTVPDVVAMMPSFYASQCTIHPTTLDSCFHPAWAALPNSILRKLGLSVPRNIRNIFIGRNIPASPGSELGLRVGIEEASQNGFRVSISVYSIEDLSRTPIVSIEGLSMIAISDSPVSSPVDELMLLHTVWQPSLAFLSPSDLQAHIIECADPAEAVVFDELQQATVNVIHDALNQLTPDVEKNLEWYYKKYVDWMREQDATFFSSMVISNEQEKLDLYSRVTLSSVNGRMLDLVARNLPKFFRKEADPLETMTTDGFLSEYYANMIKLTRCLNHVKKYMKIFAHENPGARILEIGAGTGSCTEAALQGLSQSSTGSLLAEKYVFTDVSAGFFEAADQRFAPFASQMRFQKLDIEQDPLEQGFVEGDYDLIISCNCLHATTSLQNTLSNARKLLKTEGKLLLLETTTPHLDQSLTFGLFSGWWLSEEQERRTSPLLSAPAWSRFLASSGFTGVDVALGDAGGPDVSNYSVMIATAADVPKTNGVGQETLTLMAFPPSTETYADWLKVVGSALEDTSSIAVTIVQNLTNLTADASLVCILATDPESLVSMTWADFEYLKRILVGVEKVLWVSHGAALESNHPSAALHTGLFRTLRMEQGDEKYITLDLDSNRELCTSESVKAICKVAKLALKAQITPERELAERAGRILVPRLHKNDYLINQMEPSLEDLGAAQNTDSSNYADIALDPRGAYIVVGGLTGIGREVVRWLAHRGAKNVILISRNANISNTQDLQSELLSTGTKLIPYGCDVACKNDLEKFLVALKIIMPIRGVIQAALVLDDSSFANMTIDQWQTPLRPKYHGSKNLDELFQGADELDFFIMLSSVTGILGSHGQSNYTAGSTYQDALARSRVCRGLPGVSIDLGSVLGAGYVARTSGVAERAAKAGWRSHTIHEVLRMIGIAVRNPKQAEIIAGITPWSVPEHLAWRQEGRFSALPLRLESLKTLPKELSTVSLRERLEAASADTKVDTMVYGLVIRLADMFVLSPSDINQSQPLAALGVDSLVAVELRNWLAANVTPNVTVFDVTQSSSLIELAEKVVRKLA